MKLILDYGCTTYECVFKREDVEDEVIEDLINDAYSMIDHELDYLEVRDMEYLNNSSFPISYYICDEIDEDFDFNSSDFVNITSKRHIPKKQLKDGSYIRTVQYFTGCVHIYDIDCKEFDENKLKFYVSPQDNENIITDIINYDGKDYKPCDLEDEFDVFDFRREKGFDTFLIEIKDGKQTELEEIKEIKIPDKFRIKNGILKKADVCGNVVIPDSVTEIGEEAFKDCTGLTSVVLPKSVKKIGYGAFEYCTNLTTIDIPDSVTEIGEKAFRGCTGLTTIDIPDSVTEIGRDAFVKCSRL